MQNKKDTPCARSQKKNSQKKMMDASRETLYPRLYTTTVVVA